MTEVPTRSWVQVISREEIRHFAVAINAMDPIHHDVTAAQAAGYRDLVAPVSFYSVLGLSVGRVVPSSELRQDGLPLADQEKGRMVGGETTVEWFGDIEAGDEVTLTEYLEGTFEKQGRSGPLKGFRYFRSYEVEGRVVVRESYTRIAR